MLSSACAAGEEKLDNMGCGSVGSFLKCSRDGRFAQTSGISQVALHESYLSAELFLGVAF